MTQPKYPGELNTVPVKAGLLANWACQSMSMLNVLTSSRASALPYGFYGEFRQVYCSLQCLA